MIWVILTQIILLFTLGWWGLLFIPVVVGLVILMPQQISTTTPTRPQSATTSTNTASISSQIEAERRVKIINESLSIIESTNNLETLILRAATIHEHLDWCFWNEITLSNEPHIDSLKKVDVRINAMIVRIARYQVDEFQIKFNHYKTNAKYNLVPKIYELIDKCKSSLLAASNCAEANEELMKIRDRIEDIYSRTN